MRRNASGENSKLPKWSRVDNRSARAFVVQRVSFISRFCHATARKENSIIPAANGSRKNIRRFNGKDTRKFPKLCHKEITILMRITSI